MKDRVLEAINRVLELEAIDETCSQATCEKWDSMAQLNIVLELEDEFNIQIEPDEIGRMKSVEDILVLLKAKLNV